ncbi:MAG: hypothetical protein LUQ69_09670 [Methanoregulaceae archaeon]|nr:hypothetical protein [Methanoregulaceae archaeon]
MQFRRSMACLLAVSAVWLWCFASDGASTQVMVEKNLFAQDRKPPSPESAVQTPQPNKPGLSAKAVQLDGVFFRGDTRKAIVRVKGQLPGADKTKPQNPYITVGEGEKLGEFQVVKIEPRSISLEKDGQTEVIKLFDQGKVVVPPPPVPTSPTPAPAVAPPQAGQAPPAGVQGPMGGQPPQPPLPQGQMGVNMPGVAQPPNVANQPGGHRAIAPPGQNQPDANAGSEDEGDVEEEEPGN